MTTRDHDNRITETIDSHETIAIHAEMFADNIGLGTAWLEGTATSTLDIFNADDDGTYQDGKVTRLRIVAWGNDPEAGSRLIGMTGNQVTAYEIIISAGTPVELAGEIMSATIGELG